MDKYDEITAQLLDTRAFFGMLVPEQGRKMVADAIRKAVEEGGCSSSQVLTSIEAVLDGIAALQTALPALGVPAELAKQIGDYASAAATGVGQCSSVLAAGGDTATVVAKCGQLLSAAVQPVLPPGTPMQVAGLVATIAAEIQAVYAAIEAQAPAPSPTVKTNALALAKAKPSTWKPSEHDRARLMALSARAMQLAGKK